MVHGCDTQLTRMTHAHSKHNTMCDIMLYLYMLVNATHAATSHACSYKVIHAAIIVETILFTTSGALILAIYNFYIM